MLNKSLKALICFFRIKKPHNNFINRTPIKPGAGYDHVRWEKING